MDKPTLYVLVGVPGAGKTTWAKSQSWFEDCVYISTDKIVEEYAHSVGKTYSEVFKDYMPKAVEKMLDEVGEAKWAGANIIWDQTSTTRISREKKLRMMPNYTKIAVVFKTPNAEDLTLRLDRPGKDIPMEVVNNFIENFQDVENDEGFDVIWRV